MESTKFNVGDKIFYVNRETDSEVEGYIYKDIGDDVHWIKIREGSQFIILPGYRLTKIEPKTWESLEENLEKYGLSMDIGENEPQASMKMNHKCRFNNGI